MNKEKNSSKETAELEKSKPIVLAGIEYTADCIVHRTILKNPTGNISVMSFDDGQGLTEWTSPFDSFSQIIEGSAEIIVDKVSNLLATGQGIIIPAYARNSIKPNGRFKMIFTILNNGHV